MDPLFSPALYTQPQCMCVRWVRGRNEFSKPSLPLFPNGLKLSAFSEDCPNRLHASSFNGHARGSGLRRPACFLTWLGDGATSSFAWFWRKMWRLLMATLIATTRIVDNVKIWSQYLKAIAFIVAASEHRVSGYIRCHNFFSTKKR